MKRFSLIMALLLVLALTVVACAAPAPEPAPTPAPEPAPSPEPAPEITLASIVKGGLMYDKWWRAVPEATEPTAHDHPLWAFQTTNQRSGSDTWRCKECHGWDYQGKDGAYGSGSHFTGFPGVYAASAKNEAQLLAQLMGGTNPQHDFTTVLSETALRDLVNFLKEGTIDVTEHIDYATKKPIGASVPRGEELYTSTCVFCHGADGKKLNFGSEAEPEYLSGVANGNPWEVLHKIRFGQPGTGMPSGVKKGWSVQDAVDVLGYLQTLPE